MIDIFPSWMHNHEVTLSWVVIGVFSLGLVTGTVFVFLKKRR